ncbi:hypothetical protein [Pectinatus frisingensis]|uniref:hypothetical protein n=1 Tax=Pectinatus frisingensis TaxID=865 RepID=UPI0018C7D9E4|nr:hypothetical protein [Pectinatus frisingensis]
MNTKQKLLVLKLDVTDSMKEADSLWQAVGSMVKMNMVVCRQSADILTAAVSCKPDWIHIISRSDSEHLFFTDGTKQSGSCKRISLIKQLLKADPVLTLLSLNSKLDKRDAENIGQLKALLGMENGYNPLASRLFIPRFYSNICMGMALAPAAKIAISSMQPEVISHGGIPAMCFNKAIDPETFTFVKQRYIPQQPIPFMMQ